MKILNDVCVQIVGILFNVSVHWMLIVVWIEVGVPSNAHHSGDSRDVRRRAFISPSSILEKDFVLKGIFVFF